MKDQKRLSIIIPALNEEKGVEKTIQAIPKEELEHIDYETQVLVVDNGSEDETSELAKKAGAKVIFEPKRGYGNALKAGFAYASGDIIATADADATYPVNDIPKLIKILENENLDFLTTNRFALLEKGAMSFRNRIGNKVLSISMRLLFGLNIKDSQSGMWVFRRSILGNLKLSSNTPLSQELKIEACHFAKCNWKETPIEYRPRTGKAKLGGWKVGLGNLFHLIKKRVIR